jgi:periplasmic divalent cation tolerance protein
MKQTLDRPSEVGIAPPDAVVLALANAPDPQVAQRIARALVEERLAACVNILGACESVYRWQGAIEQATEVPLLIKTTRRRWTAMAARFVELHPFEVPELIAFAPDAILPAYAAWVIGQTRESASLQPRGAPDRG